MKKNLTLTPAEAVAEVEAGDGGGGGRRGRRAIAREVLAREGDGARRRTGRRTEAGRSAGARFAGEQGVVAAASTSTTCAGRFAGDGAGRRARAGGRGDGAAAGRSRASPGSRLERSRASRAAGTCEFWGSIRRSPLKTAIKTPLVPVVCYNRY